MGTTINKLYPLKFNPILKQRVWGGDNLVTKFHKYSEDNPTSNIGESWEVSDIEGSCSVVSEGYLAENDLTDILETYMGDLVGDNIFQYYGCYFPLIIKFLDIKESLSVQVHPDDTTALERYSILGKDEFWYVLDAAPDAKIYMGFKEDISAAEFYQRCKDGTVEEVLNVFHPKRGECFHITPGTVHSASGGLVLCEIQESSDITFRLYDWGRENSPQKRDMHLDEAIDCIDYSKYDEELHTFATLSQEGSLLEDGSHFSIKGIKISKPLEVSTDSYSSFLIYTCIGGSAVLQHAGSKYTLSLGETILIPSNMDDFTIAPQGGEAELLCVYINALSDEEDDYINEGVSEEIK